MHTGVYTATLILYQRKIPVKRWSEILFCQFNQFLTAMIVGRSLAEAETAGSGEPDDWTLRSIRQEN
jgi:hypothetical protein